MPTIREESYAYQLAIDYNFVPHEDAKYDAISLDDNQWNFRFAKRFGDNTRILMEVDGADLL